MAYTEAQVIARISTVLNDTATAIWGTAEIRAQIDQALREISLYSPRTAKATVTFASTVKELSLASITDYLSIDQVEFEVDKDPRRYRNFVVRGSSVILDITFAPSAGDTAFIWYDTTHSLSGTTTNTMNPQEERLLIDLVAGQLAINKAVDKINEVNVGGTRTWVDFQTWGERKASQTLRDLHSIAKRQVTQEWPRVR